MNCLYANNVVGTLSIAVGSIDTVLQLTPGHGTGFPTISLNQWFYVTLVNPANGDIEICRVTERTGDTLVVSRGVDGTIPRSWAAGSIIEMRLTAEMLRELQDTGIDPDTYLPRAGGDIFGPVRWLETETSPDGWTQNAIGGGDMLLDSLSPDRQLLLYPRSVVGNGRVVIYRLQYGMLVKDITTTTEDLFSGRDGVASYWLSYKNAAAGNLRIVSGAGNTAWQRGNFFHLMWHGVGAPTLTPGPGVTLLIPSGYIARPRARNSVITAMALSQTEWVITGDMAEQ